MNSQSVVAFGLCDVLILVKMSFIGDSGSFVLTGGRCVFPGGFFVCLIFLF